jgi:hypothetical protein
MICHSRDNLQFHCIKRRGHAHHAMDASARMSFYRAEARQGNIQLLCGGCHAEVHKIERRAGEQGYPLRGHEPSADAILLSGYFNSNTSSKGGEL